MKFSQLTAILIYGVCSLPNAALAHSLPLGDGNVTTSPSQGDVYACQTRFNPNAPGARASGEWLNAAGGTWDPELKPFVDGAVTWPSEINIYLEGATRIISGNGLPNHETGVFPVARTDNAYQYDRNPNTIQENNILLRLDANPTLANTPTCVPMGMIGFALSGAAIYNALDARGLDAAAHEILDKCGGHPQQSGQYHYHDEPTCIVDNSTGPDGHSDLLGYALDGFGIFGNSERTGVTLSSSDLDECHGHVGPIEWDGQIIEMYHYHFTQDYPYTIGCFAGEVTTTQIGNNNQDRLGRNDERRGPPQGSLRRPHRPLHGPRP